MAVAKKQKPRATGHHKKRVGHHQTRTNHFMKAYWPYLPMAFLVGAAMLFNSLWLQPSVLSYATNMTASGLLSGTNNERTARGLGKLAINSKLNQAAQAKAQDMVNKDYWSHNTPSGQEPWVFIDATGYQYNAAGENLAYGFSTSSGAITGWMNSPGHKANILNTKYTEVGFGIANSPDYQGSGEQTVVVAFYAKPVTVVASKPAPKPAPAPAPVETKPAPEPEEEKETEQPIAVGTADTPDGNPSNGDKVTVSATVPGPTKVARVQLATSGAAPWSLFAVSALAVVLLVFFITRHSLAWHRALIRGEAFVLKHRVLDFFVVAVIMAAAIMSQTVGFIQ